MFERLERSAVKVARYVLRGRDGGNTVLLLGRGGGQLLSGGGILRGQKHLEGFSQCGRFSTLWPRLRDKAGAREATLIEQGHEKSDPPLAKNTA
jgi:hypothetical protein